MINGVRIVMTSGNGYKLNKEPFLQYTAEEIYESILCVREDFMYVTVVLEDGRELALNANSIESVEVL